MRKLELAVVLGALLFAGCGAGSYVWVSDLPAQPPPDNGEYVIRPGDILALRVVNQDAMTTRARVRPDGRFEVPILGEVGAAGKRVSALRSELEARLKDFLNTPSVSLNVEEFQPMVVAVAGEVAHPGAVTLDPKSAGVLQALAGAGGLTEYANADRVFVLRNEPQPIRVRFTYEDLERAVGNARTFTLRPGDTVVVE